jgi:hypothetical protein
VFKSILAAVALIALVSCSKSESSDGYRFEKVQWEQPQMQVTLVTHKSLADLQRAGPEVKGHAVQAWSVVNPNGQCEIHIVDPAVKYVPEFIGHELTHCAYGNFHS